ncbi:TatD family hydrolase [Echinimonas agarilytica]|uniref:TatD family hydrolase n=1 Tax=Echinimonas agarilytica TaxID=1215918 RepID=A0AA42B822_9GAMM|nr:TatD family hydrolase [Echinimonas agarilytica]
MKPIFDTHCHLDFDVFNNDRADVLTRCCRQGVSRVLVPAVQRSDWQRVIDLAENPMLRFALGLHPCWIEHHQPADLKRLEDLLTVKPNGLVAVGECGLDKVAAPEDMPKQLEFLRAQLELAHQCDLPVILHVRKAHSELQSELKKLNGIRGVIHAFSGSYELALSYINLGLKLGIGGTITYDRAAKTRAAVARLPLASLLLETDAPDMPLSGRQGQRNSPEYTPKVLSVLAELRGQNQDDVAEQLWLNSLELFAN